MTEITRIEVLNSVSSEEMLEEGFRWMKKQIELKNQQACLIICLGLYEIFILGNYQPFTKLLAIKLSVKLMNLQNQQFVSFYEDFVLHALKQYVKFRPQDSNPFKGEFYFGENANEWLKEIGIQLVSISLQCVQTWAKLFAANQYGYPSKYLLLYNKLLEKGVKFQTDFQEIQNIHPLFKIFIEPVYRKNFSQNQFKNMTKEDAKRLAQIYMQKKNEILNYLSNYCKYQIVYENWELSQLLSKIENTNDNIESLVDQLEDLQEQELSAKVSQESETLNTIQTLIRAIISKPNYSQYNKWMELRQQCKQPQDNEMQINQIKVALQNKLNEQKQMNINQGTDNQLEIKKYELEQIEKLVKQKKLELIQLNDQLQEQLESQQSSISQDSQDSSYSTISRKNEQIDDQNKQISQIINILEEKNYKNAALINQQKITIETLQRDIDVQKMDYEKKFQQQKNEIRVQKLNQENSELEIQNLQEQIQINQKVIRNEQKKNKELGEQNVELNKQLQKQNQ